MTFIDPISRKRIVCAEHVGDIVYDQEGPSAISNENVPILTGSTYEGGKLTKNDMLWRGAGDKQQGTDVWLEGGRMDELHSSHGTRKQTTTLRRKKIYKKLY